MLWLPPCRKGRAGGFHCLDDHCQTCIWWDPSLCQSRAPFHGHTEREEGISAVQIFDNPTHWGTREAVNCPHSPDRDPLTRWDFFWKILLFSLFLLGFPQAGEQLPARGDFFALMQTSYTYWQEAALFSKSTSAEEPAPKEGEEIQSAAWAASITHHPAWPMAAGGKEVALALGLVSWLRTCMGKVGSHWGQE